MAQAAKKYWVALGVALVLFVLSRTDQGRAIVMSATDAIGGAVLGLQLNNPLNVERGASWQGLAADQPHARFAKFVSMPYGIRAAARILLTYRSAYGLTTVPGIINRWNPVSDGQPATYVPNVLAALGVTEKTPIDVRQRATAFALVRAMIRQEIGAAAAVLVSDADVSEGLRLAGIA